MTILEIQIATHLKSLDYRNLVHLVNSESFELAYKKSKEKEVYDALISKCDLRNLRSMIKKDLNTELDTKTLDELRKYAASLGIINANKYLKAHLLSIIKERLNCDKRRNNIGLRSSIK